jgi:hypothetical protein
MSIYIALCHLYAKIPLFMILEMEFAKIIVAVIAMPS